MRQLLLAPIIGELVAKAQSEVGINLPVLTFWRACSFSRGMERHRRTLRYLTVMPRAAAYDFRGVADDHGSGSSLLI